METQETIGLTYHFLVLLEWLDEVGVHRLKSYGDSRNYRISIPLLSNILDCMENAILANQGQKCCHIVLNTCMNPNVCMMELNMLVSLW